MNNKPQIIWVQKEGLPMPGQKCSVCLKGYLEKQNDWCVFCPICLQSWRVSKFPLKGREFQKAVPAVEEVKDKVVQALRDIWVKLDEILNALKKN